MCKQIFRRQTWVLCLSFMVVMIGFGLSGCGKEQNTEIPFQTIAEGVGGLGYESKKPALIIMTRPEAFESLALDVTFPPDLLEKVSSLDYEQYFVVLVLQGLQGTSGYHVAVQHIVQEGDQIFIQADFIQPELNTMVLPVLTSPYHLIAVSKEGFQNLQVNFLLVEEDVTLFEVAEVIP